jgi:hypothetical protein
MIVIVKKRKQGKKKWTMESIYVDNAEGYKKRIKEHINNAKSDEDHEVKIEHA